jgi:hypothetical protein
MKKRGAIFPKYDRPHLFQPISLLQLPKLNTIVIRMSMAIAVWLFGCLPMMRGQSAFERELWNNYNSAPDFPAQKAAFDKLEKFYRLFHLDSALVVCNQFRALAAQSQPDYVPFVDLRIAATYTRKLDLDKAGSMLIPILEKAEQERNDSLRASALLNLSNLNRRKTWFFSSPHFMMP